MRNFAIFATFARANFVGKESNESTVMYQVKSRITPIMERKRNGNGSIMIRAMPLVTKGKIIYNTKYNENIVFDPDT